MILIYLVVGLVAFVCSMSACNDASFVWCQQETERQQDAHVAAGIPMTDLERQFFANSQPQDSSDSSSDSDQESVNAASDDEDDGLDHF